MAQLVADPRELSRNMPDQDPLAQLRDIHLPDAISFWPLAPGWWIVGLLLILLLLVVCNFLYRSKKRNRYRVLAVRELANLDQYFGQPALYLQHLNHLLKQTALATESTTDIAALSGNEWLDFLDFTGKTTQFNQGAGRVLNHGPYAPSVPELDPETLQLLCKQWIMRHDFPKSGAFK